MFSIKYAFFLDLVFPPRSDIIMPESAKPGDVLLLTKPLGTQVSSSAKGFKRIAIRSNYKYNIKMLKIDTLDALGDEITSILNIL